MPQACIASREAIWQTWSHIERSSQPVPFTAVISPLQYYNDFGDIIKETLNRTRQMDKMESARTLVQCLQQVWRVLCHVMCHICSADCPRPPCALLPAAVNTSETMSPLSHRPIMLCVECSSSSSTPWIAYSRLCADGGNGSSAHTLTHAQISRLCFC